MARKQFLLRIDPELWRELEKWAADDLRSVNAQVEWLLRDAVSRRRGGRAKQAPAGRTSEEEKDDDDGGLSLEETGEGSISRGRSG